MKKISSFILATFFIVSAINPTAYAAMPSLSFTVNLSENVFVDTTGGTPTITIDVGGVSRTASYASGTGTNALVFTYAPTAGDLDLDGITLTSPIALNGGTMSDTAGNAASLTFTLPNTSGVKVNYPSLSLDFMNGASGRYTLNRASYTSLPSFLTAVGGSFTRASNATNYVAGSAIKQAVYYDTNAARHAQNGSLGTADTVVTVPPVNLLRVGARRAGTNKLNGWIQNVKYYPLRPSGTQLQLLTQ